MTSKSPYALTRSILLAMFAGGTLGWLLGPQTIPLGVVGKMYIQLIKVIAVPLVLFTIVEAVLTTNLSWETARRWFVVIVVNACSALALGLVISNFFRPGVGFFVKVTDATPPVASTVKEFSLAAFFNSFIPSSIVSPFAENNILAVVLVALLFGAAIRAHLAKPSAEISLVAAQRVIKAAAGVVSVVILWLVKLVPVAVFCVTARTVGEYGFAPFKGLAFYVALGSLGLMLQVFVVYPCWVVLVGKYSFAHFLKVAQKPIAYAFGTNSSLATLPITLQALDELKVPKAASRLGACIGTNFNNDGIILYEAMAVLFVAQALGIELSLGEQIFAAGMSLLAAIGVAGVPEAGVVSLSLVLSSVGLPLDILPLLLTVDWIIARVRSVTNVMSDMTVSIAVAGLGREGPHGHAGN